MSTDAHRFGFSKSENKANSASGQAHQYINSAVYNAIPPCKWDRTKKSISILLIVIVIVLVVVVSVLKAHSHSVIQSSSTTTGTQTTPAVAPTRTQTSPQTLPASGTSTPDTTAPSSAATSAAVSATLPPPPKPTADGLHLVNACNGTVEYSGFAYYDSAVDGNNGAQPKDHANTTTNVYAEWENQNRTALFTRTNTFAWAFINSTNAPVNKADGEASNGHRSFVCYKDDGRLLFQQNGFNFSTEYYCQ